MSVLPSNQSQGFLKSLGLGAIQTAPQGIAQLLASRKESRENKLEDEAIKRLTGEDVTGLSPDMKRIFMQKALNTKPDIKFEKEHNLQTGLGTIKRMRELIESAGPSNLVQSFFGIGDTREKRAELEALGRSLIPLVAAGVPIRNQKEFEEYRKIITNPNSRQADLEGALNGIENLLQRSLNIGDEKEITESKKTKGKEKFSPQNLEHKKKAEQLYKKYKDKKKVKEILEKEFEF